MKKIKCPHCSAILKIAIADDAETNKIIICPVCHEKKPLSQYLKYEPKVVEGTAYPSDKKTDLGGTEFENKKTCIGMLVIESIGKPCILKEGRNVIGRDSDSSKADIKINTGNKCRMSREHFVIDVKNEPQMGWVHRASLYKERVNSTYVNDEKLEYGDCVILNHGDIIKFPDCTVEFIQDPNKTLVN
jgi:hypothetical protein